MSVRNAAASIALVLSAAALAPGALAQEGAKAQKGEGPCAEDAKKFCKGMQPGGGRIARCMKQHEAELSPACQSAIKEAEQKLEEFSKDCKADIDKLCKGIRPGGGRILACLKSHQSDLAPACAEEFNRAAKK